MPTLSRVQARSAFDHVVRNVMWDGSSDGPIERALHYNDVINIFDLVSLDPKSINNLSYLNQHGDNVPTPLQGGYRRTIEIFVSFYRYREACIDGTTPIGNSWDQITPEEFDEYRFKTAIIGLMFSLDEMNYDMPKDEEQCYDSSDVYLAASSKIKPLSPTPVPNSPVLNKLQSQPDHHQNPPPSQPNQLLAELSPCSIEYPTSSDTASIVSDYDHEVHEDIFVMECKAKPEWSWSICNNATIPIFDGDNEVSFINMEEMFPASLDPIPPPPTIPQTISWPPTPLSNHPAKDHQPSPTQNSIDYLQTQLEPLPNYLVADTPPLPTTYLPDLHHTPCAFQGYDPLEIVETDEIPSPLNPTTLSYEDEELENTVMVEDEIRQEWSWDIWNNTNNTTIDDTDEIAFINMDELFPTYPQPIPSEPYNPPTPQTHATNDNGETHREDKQVALDSEHKSLTSWFQFDEGEILQHILQHPNTHHNVSCCFDIAAFTKLNPQVISDVDDHQHTICHPTIDQAGKVFTQPRCNMMHDVTHVQQNTFPLLATPFITTFPTTITPSTTNPNNLVPFEIHGEVPSTYKATMLQVKQQQQLTLPFASNIQPEAPLEIGGPQYIGPQLVFDPGGKIFDPGGRVVSFRNIEDIAVCSKEEKKFGNNQTQHANDELGTCCVNGEKHVTRRSMFPDNSVDPANLDTQLNWNGELHAAVNKNTTTMISAPDVPLPETGERMLGGITAVLDDNPMVAKALLHLPEFDGEGSDKIPTGLRIVPISPEVQRAGLPDVEQSCSFCTMVHSSTCGLPCVMARHTWCRAKLYKSYYGIQLHTWYVAPAFLAAPGIIGDGPNNLV
jgi:hypothetical protein